MYFKYALDNCTQKHQPKSDALAQKEDLVRVCLGYNTFRNVGDLCTVCLMSNHLVYYSTDWAIHTVNSHATRPQILRFH